MKNQFLSIFFCQLYLLAMVKPLIPLLEYYANYDYIATELCKNKDKQYLKCNGKCYLEEMLNKTDHTNHKHKSTIPSINLDDYPVSPLVQFVCQFSTYENASGLVYGYSQYNLQEYLFPVFHPPQA